MYMHTITRPSTVLTKAKATLSNGWCKGSLAKASKKTAAAAHRFCALGGILEGAGAAWRVEFYDSDGDTLPGFERGCHVLVDPIITSYDAELTNKAEEYVANAIHTIAATGKGAKARIAREALGDDCRSDSEIVFLFNDALSTRRAWVVEAFEARKAEQRERQARSRAARRQLVGASA
jgi:hypothetical protein